MPTGLRGARADVNPLRVIIVGASHGGVQLAASLRLDGFDGRIALIEREAGLPYQRPPLSKAFMKGAEAASFPLRPFSFYAANAIELLSGLSVTSIERGPKLVRTSDGADHAYDHLVIACGGRNVVPPLPGLACRGIYTLRTRNDAIALRDALTQVRRVAVIGGGFIGLEFAAVARGLGIDVTVIEAAARLMARVVSPAISGIFLDRHRDSGVTVLLGTPAAGVIDDGAGRASGVRLADGRIVEADAVLVAAGVRPETDIAEAAGLALDDGIAVDGSLTTSDPSISAIGDCASLPVAGTGPRIRLESVQAASDQARAVSQRLTGRPAEYAAIPWFWSDQGPFKLQIAGLAAGTDASVTTTPMPGQTAVFCFADGTLKAVETVNAPGEHLGARKLLGAGKPVSLAQLERESFSIRATLATLADRPVR